MLRTLRPDTVAVDTVFGRHAQVIAYALNLGIHVLTEKPVATTLPQWETVRDALAGSRGRLFALFTARFEPWFYTAHTLMQQGIIGDPLLLHGQKSYILGRRPDFYRDAAAFGSLVAWVGIHSVDQILWNTGACCVAAHGLTTRVCNGGYGDLESAAGLLLELSGGVTATLNVDYLRPANAGSHGDDRLRIVGTKGILEVRDNQVFFTGGPAGGTETVPLLPPPQLYDVFCDYCRGEDRPLTAGINGLEATRACLMAEYP